MHTNIFKEVFPAHYYMGYLNIHTLYNLSHCFTSIICNPSILPWTDDRDNPVQNRWDRPRKKGSLHKHAPLPPKTMLEKIGRTAECCSRHLITKKLNIVLGGRGELTNFWWKVKNNQNFVYFFTCLIYFCTGLSPF